MAAVANNPAFAKKVGVPQSVGQDFNKADKGRKFSKGGDTMAKFDPKMFFKGKESKSEEKSEKKAFPTKGGYKKAEAKFEGEKMAAGGMTGSLAKHASMPASKAHAGLKSGGYVKAADGIAQRGKTKGRVC